MKRHLLLGLAAALGLIASSGRAHAEYFEYSATVSVDPRMGITGTSGIGTDKVVMTTTGNDTITLTGLPSPGGGHENAIGGTDVVFGGISVSVTPNSPYQNISFDFTYSLTLTDYSTAQGGTPTGTNTILVSGRLGDSIGAGRRVNLGNLMNYSLMPANGMITVGSAMYQIKTGINNYVPPGVGNAGRFGATVTLVPEPASWASLSIGLTGVLGLFFRSRMRRQLV